MAARRKKRKTTKRQHGDVKPTSAPENIAEKRKATKQSVEESRPDSANSGKNGGTNDCFGYTSFIILGFILFLAPWMFSNGVADSSLLPKRIFLQLGSIIFIFSLVFDTKNRPDRIQFFWWLDGPILLFIGWCWLSLLWARDSFSGMQLILHWTSASLMFYGIRWIFRDKKQLFPILSALLLGGLCMSLVGLFQFFGEVKWFSQHISPAATFVNKNMAAQYVALCLPAGVALLFLFRRWQLLIPLGIILGIILSYITITVTRAVWLSIFTQACVWVLFLLFIGKKTGKWSRRRMLMPISTIGICAAFLGLFLFLSWPAMQLRTAKTIYEISNISETIQDPFQSRKMASGSLELRTIWWRESLTVFKENPLAGAGINNFNTLYPLGRSGYRPELFAYRPDLKHAHNDFVQLLVETGLVGLILLGLAVAWFIKRTLSWLSAPVIIGELGESGTAEFIFITMGVAAVCGLGANMCFSFPVYRALPVFQVGFYLAVLVIFLTNRSPSRDSTSQSVISLPTPWRLRSVRVIISSFLCLAFIFLGWKHLQWFRADRYYMGCRYSIEHQEWEKAVRQGEHAHTLNPARREWLIYLARGYIKTERLDKAQGLFSILRRTYPYDREVLFQHGRLYEEQKRMDEARIVWEKLVSLFPAHAGGNDALGRIYGQKGKRKKALACFQKAVESSPDNASYLQNLAVELTFSGKWQNAVDLFIRAVELDSNNGLLHAYTGLAMLRLPEHTEEALIYLERSIELDPEHKLNAQVINILKQSGRTNQ